MVLNCSLYMAQSTIVFGEWVHHSLVNERLATERRNPHSQNGASVQGFEDFYFIFIFSSVGGSVEDGDYACISGLPDRYASTIRKRVVDHH